MQNIKVNQERLWNSLMEMAKIGATEKGGVCRLALTDEDKEARDLYVKWCKDAGCTIEIDQMGNIFARRKGKDNSLPPICTGSHIDSQPTGGKYDGIYGVLAGLEVVRTLNDLNYETNAPIEISAWTNEEGSRFAPAMIGSGVFGGEFSLKEGLECSDRDGRTIDEELKRIGYAGDKPCEPRPLGAFFEAHIEQGPILEAEKKTIGVVQGVQGIRWFEIEVTGMESHAGTTPMERRKDALVGVARMIDAANSIGNDTIPDGRTTIGYLEVKPNSTNVIPGQVFFRADIRHPNAEKLDEMEDQYQKICEDICKNLSLKLDFKRIWYSEPVAFDTKCIAAVQEAADSLRLPNQKITSGAGHDAVYISRVAPTAMIFIPCEDGISHNEIEEATPGDLAAGCNVLANAMISRANND